MDVKILNPEQTKEIFRLWGEASKICYDTKNVSPETVGRHCLNSGHFSGSRSQYILFEITDCPRFVVDQVVRHESGTMKNVQSFRYVNKSNFNAEIPKEISEELRSKYCQHMKNTVALYEEIQEYVANKTGSKERGNEQARYVLPMATYTNFVFGMDIEALIHYCHTRLCVRTEDKHRELAQKIRNAVIEILPEIEDCLVPNCQYLLWCPEKHGCGIYPSKLELKNKK